MSDVRSRPPASGSRTKDATGGSRPGRGARWGIWFAIWSSGGLLLFVYHHLSVLAEGGSWPIVVPFINEMTAALGSGLGYFAIRALVRRLPLERGMAARRLPAYLAAVLAYSALETSWRWGARIVVFRLVGLGIYDYGRMPLRYFMELPIDVIVFVIVVAAIHVWRHVERTRNRELDALRLERSLADANLHNLRLQLQPHFLFNALNTVSASMYQDVEKADEMISRLADLLRGSLRTAREDRVPLAEELAVLDDYFALMRARFEDRLRVTVDVENGAEQSLVPPFLFQPLVENAIRHGGMETRGAGSIRVGIRADGEALVIEVEDDGPGLAAGVDPLENGLGLRATAERLRLLYGEAHRLEVAPGASGGFRVLVRIPREDAAS